MNWKKLIGIIIILGIIFAGAIFLIQKEQKTSLQPEMPQPEITQPEQKTTSINDVVKANNKFAFDYYSILKNKNRNNIFFSPFSVSSALAMTYEGARGKTAEEMQSVFYFPKSKELRKVQYKNIFKKINKKDKKYKLHIANALWVQNKYKLLKDYSNIVKEYYQAKISNLNFAKNPEDSRITINSWTEDKTENKIKDLIPRGAITSSTRLVLTNAIYFKGDWLKQFDKNNTREEMFKINKDEKVKTPIMRRTDKKAKFNYFENEKLQVLEMPYSGENLSMIILLPKENHLANIESSLNYEKLLKWKNEFKKQLVKVFIPKFKFDTKYFMPKDLKKMGMLRAFNKSRADFSGISGKKDLFISDIIHQAFVEVNEKGTEAAAATAVMMLGDSLKPEKPKKIPVFRADHPFIFLIQDKSNENILFMGRVTNPNL